MLALSLLPLCELGWAGVGQGKLQLDNILYLQYSHPTILIMDNANILPTPSETRFIIDMMLKVQRLPTPSSNLDD
jgi:hypothetical protein